jgi:uncharacterized SAM-dependent methyltransferase
MSVLAFPKKQILEQPDELAQDLLELFSLTRQGHMEKWSYADADRPEDPAGGTEIWNQITKYDGYYPTSMDVKAVRGALNVSGVQAILRSIVNIVELGPGSAQSISQKTLPFLVHAKQYTAVDISALHADQAAGLVEQSLQIKTSVRYEDYIHPNIAKEGREKTGFVMWGISIGNMEGKPGEAPLPRLIQNLSSLADCCNDGDSLFLSIDTEHNQDALMRAYDVPLSSRKVLSILHNAKRRNLVYGNFTPERWTHKPVWHAEVGQYAHYLISGRDQDFILYGQRVKIPAGRAFNAINIYKFTPDTVLLAAKAAGFSRAFLTDDRPIALLVATK